jgi:hypothetical protein
MNTVPIDEIESILKRYDRMSGIEFYGWDTYEDLIHEFERLVKTYRAKPVDDNSDKEIEI